MAALLTSKVNPFTWRRTQRVPDEETGPGGANTRKFPHLTITSQLNAVFGSWINIMLAFVPVGIALNYALDDTTNNKIIVFVFNFLAIIPLAAMLSHATEELAMYIGETLGGLLNATFGNAVELIVSIFALMKDEVLIVQTSLIGSMLSNLLLVMGMCFFFGGLRRTEQYFNLTVAQTAASLLALAIGSLFIPTIVAFSNNHQTGVAAISRGTAVMLLVVYVSYLIFQLRTHIDIYNEPSKKSPKTRSSKNVNLMIAPTAAGENQESPVHVEGNAIEQPDPEEVQTPQLSLYGALITLAVSTVLIAFCAECMVGAINAVSKMVSKEFIGLILLPIVGNAAEHATAVTVAIKDKMDLAIGVAIGSSLQIALLVLPVMVCVSWFGVGRPDVLTLNFDIFQISVLLIAILLVNYLILVRTIPAIRLWVTTNRRYRMAKVTGLRVSC